MKSLDLDFGGGDPVDTCLRCRPSTYYTDCVDCGVRLVRSARSKADPITARHLQNGHLAHIANRAGEHVRDAVMAKLKVSA